MTRLAARARRRERVRRGWRVGAVCAALTTFVVAWEAGFGPAGSLRGVGYGVAALAALAALAGGVAAIRASRAGAPAPDAMIGRVERLFPQTRGLLADALAAWPSGGLAEARVRSAGAWVGRRGFERLDRALAGEDRASIRAGRRRALALAVLAVGVILAQPAAGRRAAGVLGGTWSVPSAWDVSPGDVAVEYGGSVEGRIRFRGPAGAGPLAIEWRSPGGAWRVEPVAESRSGTWRWEDLRSPREYRPRYGDAAGPVHRVTVRAPFHLRRTEGRGTGGDWGPLEGRAFPGGEPLEIRGAASGPLAWAEVRTDAGDTVALTVRGEAFSGPLRPPPGSARIAVGSADGRVAVGRPFRVVAAGAAFVSILRPEADPVALEASGLALTVRAGAGAGLVGLAWETADGRRGGIDGAVGARDTTVTAVVAVAAGRAPGDTVRYRVVATPAAGRPAATAWRRAVVPSAGRLRTDAAAEREAAGRALDQALVETREESPGGAAEGEDRDARIRAAADSLGQALERTLADPALDPALAERLESARRMLEGAARADLSPRAGLPPDPALEARARAATLEAIREQVRQMEARIERAAAADTLARLADDQRSLARETGETPPGALEERIGERQDRLEERAQAAERLGETAAARVRSALERARAAIEAGRPEAAARAQMDAAGQMDSAAAAEREDAARDAELEERRRPAMDRAGGEALYLADAQRRLATDGPATADRRARQSAVTRGLERTLNVMVEAIGGQPAARELAAALAGAVARTRYADAALAAASGGSGVAEETALADAAESLAALARALLVPQSGGAGMPGAGASEGQSGGLSRELAELAEAQRSLAEAGGAGEEAAGGNPDAPAAERGIAEALGRLEERLAEAGVDPAVAAALTRSAEETAGRMERGLAGARTQTELRTLARRLEELARALERTPEERRRSEPAGAFVPVAPPDLPARVTAPRLDAETELAPWRDALPRTADETARRYLERLEDEGVRSPESAP